MNEPRKRRWFQFHLATALAMMCMLVGFIWMNTRNEQYLYAVHNETPHGMEFLDCLGNAYGWPWLCVWIEDNIWVVWNRAAGNTLLALATAATVGSVCEYFLRRREVRKLPPETRN